MRTLWQAALAVLIMLALPTSSSARADEPATFVGAQACAGCHTAQYDAWKASHHALAMQQATQTTVLGDFADATLEHFGVTTSFFRNGDKLMVRTAGPDGTLHDYPIAYTFGVYPLQQYLIALPRRSAAGARHRLGQPAKRPRRAALVPPLSRSAIQAWRPIALDRARPDLELPMR
jgi:hypothetical protein